MTTIATLFAVEHKGELARLLAELMVSRRMTKADLARQSGVSQAHISRILAGQNLPSVAVLDQLATALDVDPTHLHRAYATTIGLRGMGEESIADDDLLAIMAIWPDVPPEQRAAQRASLEAILRALRNDGD